MQRIRIAAAAQREARAEGARESTARSVGARSIEPLRTAFAIAASLVVAGCSSLRPAAPGTASGDVADPVSGTSGAATARPAALVAFEDALRERATVEGREGRLADAAVSWEVLTVLRPDEPDYRERLDAIRVLIDRAVPERLARAALAWKRGDLDAAAAQYLSALALQPDQVVAADALRAIERERNRRHYLGRPSRTTLTRRATLDALATAPAASETTSAPRE